MRKYKIIWILTFLLIVLTLFFFYFRFQVYYARGLNAAPVNFVIEKGEGNKIIGERLEQKKIIRCRYCFYYFMLSEKLSSKIIPGEYLIPQGMTIPQVAQFITDEIKKELKITFPEGWTASQMAERLRANGLPADDFLRLVNNPEALKNAYDFLSDPKITSLEGYLFPDTYFFSYDTKASAIIEKMLKNFKSKIKPDLMEDIQKNNLSLNDIVIMASIIEGEVRTEEDRKIVSGIFWKRIKNNQPLQSCATLAYVTGERKKQYSESDTKIQSPFNTYLVTGLPPAPIATPTCAVASAGASLMPSPTIATIF